VSTLLKNFVALALAAAGTAALGEDKADLDRTQVIGNRELPKVLYIAPWKKPPPGDLAGRPLVSVLDEALAPVDRDVFRRTVQYDTQARTVAAQHAQQPAPLVPLVTATPVGAAPAATTPPPAAAVPAPAAAVAAPAPTPAR
jgi:hypothetical protein